MLKKPKEECCNNCQSHCDCGCWDYNRGYNAYRLYHEQEIERSEDRHEIEMNGAMKAYDKMEKDKNQEKKALEALLEEVTQGRKVYYHCNQDLLAAINKKEDEIAKLKETIKTEKQFCKDMINFGQDYEQNNKALRELLDFAYQIMDEAEGMLIDEWLKKYKEIKDA